MVDTQGLPIERVEVPNPREMMGDQETNCYLVGTREVVIVDPGSPEGVEVVSRTLASRGNPPVIAIVLTHGHPDHVAAAGELRRRLECPVMLHPADRPILRSFLPWDAIDQELADGVVITLPEGSLTVVETPGHSPGHVALWDEAGKTLLAGDLFSGNGTVAIIYPYGSMRAYLESLYRVRALRPRRILPGHGPEISAPERVIADYIERRLHREQQIRTLLGSAPLTVDELVSTLYPDVLPQFRRAAAATVLAHLQKLGEEGEVEPLGEDAWHCRWRALSLPSG